MIYRRKSKPDPLFMARWRRRLLVSLATAFLFWLAASFLITYKLTHRLGARTGPPPPPLDIPVETVQLKTSDGETLGAWLAKGQPDRPAVLLLHGMTGSRANHIPLMRKLHDDGCTVMAITLRAHGDSTGETQDFGYSSRHDVIAAVERLERETRHSRIIVCGTSLGGATALFAAKALDHRVAGYLLESPYRDLNTATWNRIKMRLPIGVDYLAYAGLRLWSHVLLPIDPQSISPYNAAAEVPTDIPVVILTGARDRHATPQEAQDLFDRLQPHARLVNFKRGKHANLFKTDPNAYYDALRTLLMPPMTPPIQGFSTTPSRL